MRGKIELIVLHINSCVHINNNDIGAELPKFHYYNDPGFDDSDSDSSDADSGFAVINA